MTEAQLERLAILAEELGEAQQAIGKIIRHGYESFNPDKPDHPGNQYDLELELGQIIYITDLMCRAGDLDEETIVLKTHQRAYTLPRYTHHQPIELFPVQIGDH